MSTKNPPHIGNLKLADDGTLYLDLNDPATRQAFIDLVEELQKSKIPSLILKWQEEERKRYKR